MPADSKTASDSKKIFMVIEFLYIKKTARKNSLLAKRLTAATISMEYEKLICAFKLLEKMQITTSANDFNLLISLE